MVEPVKNNEMKLLDIINDIYYSPLLGEQTIATLKQIPRPEIKPMKFNVIDLIRTNFNVYIIYSIESAIHNIKDLSDHRQHYIGYVKFSFPKGHKFEIGADRNQSLTEATIGRKVGDTFDKDSNETLLDITSDSYVLGHMIMSQYWLEPKSGNNILNIKIPYRSEIKERDIYMIDDQKGYLINQRIPQQRIKLSDILKLQSDFDKNSKFTYKYYGVIKKIKSKDENGSTNYYYVLAPYKVDKIVKISSVEPIEKPEPVKPVITPTVEPKEKPIQVNAYRLFNLDEAQVTIDCPCADFRFRGAFNAHSAYKYAPGASGRLAGGKDEPPTQSKKMCKHIAFVIKNLYDIIAKTSSIVKYKDVVQVKPETIFIPDPDNSSKLISKKISYHYVKLYNSEKFSDDIDPVKYLSKRLPKFYSWDKNNPNNGKIINKV